MNINEIIDRIESGLEGVTPGPWTFRVKKQVGFVTGPSTSKSIPDDDFIATADYSDRSLSDDRINMQHIARCDPDTMRAIIAHIRELDARAEAAEAKVAIAKQALEIIAGKSQCIDNLMGNGDVADAALKAMEATDE